MKQVLSIMLSLFFLLTASSIFSITAFAQKSETATIGSISIPDSVYIKQEQSNTCTLAAATNMIRALFYINGNNSWSSITESSVRQVAWANGLRGSFTYYRDNSSASVTMGAVNGMSVATLKWLLDNHPEGVEIYVQGNHAVLVTDYVGDTFYCVDSDPGCASGRIPLVSTVILGRYGSQANILRNVNKYWYVNDCSINSKPTVSINKQSYFIGENIRINTFPGSYFPAILKIFRTPISGDQYLYYEGQIIGNQYSTLLVKDGYYTCALYSGQQKISNLVSWQVRETVVPTIKVATNGTEADITWSDVGAQSYYLYIQKQDTMEIPYSSNLGKALFCHLGLSQGCWKVFVTAIYAEGVTKSASFDFDIALRAPQLQVSVSGTSVDVLWNDVGAQSYYLYVEKQETMEVPYGSNLGKALSCHLELSESSWKVFVTAIYAEGVMKSTSLDFRIDNTNVIACTLGDADGDGETNITDATWIQRALAYMDIPETYDETVADVDGDGSVTITDATWIQRHLAMMTTPYAIGENITE